MFVENFIDKIIQQDLKLNPKIKIRTRFPPEPNGYLHIGHAKSILLNYELAHKYGGEFVLRYDDTNPLTIQVDCYESIKNDLFWLGIKPDVISYASEQFMQMQRYAFDLIKLDKAYVCTLTEEEFKQYKGDRYSKGRNTPDRTRSIEDNMSLFQLMLNNDPKAIGYVLRAKIDMQSGNINLRDPVMYRYKNRIHPHTGSLHYFYPSYSYAQPISDYLDNITHSICTLEFAEQQELYNWFLQQINPGSKLKQIEFARLELTNALTSKRKINTLIEQGQVKDFCDPRLHTLAGLRNRGYTNQAVKNFCYQTGISRSNSKIEIKLLEKSILEDLEHHVKRYSIVLKPLKAIISNLTNHNITVLNHPKNPALGNHQIICNQDIWLENKDFSIIPQLGRKLITPGSYCRLIGLGICKCLGYTNNTDDQPGTVYLEYMTDQNIAFIGNFHWVDQQTSIDMLIHNYQAKEYKIEHAYGERAILDLARGERFQAYRIGYLYYDELGQYKIIAQLKHNYI